MPTQAAIRGFHPPTYFRLWGTLTDFTLNVPVDGQVEIDAQISLREIVLRQRTDGTAGTTKVNVYKRTTPTARVLVGSASLVAGGGANSNARVVAAISASATATWLPTNSIEVEFETVQTEGADVTVALKWR